MYEDDVDVDDGCDAVCDGGADDTDGGDSDDDADDADGGDGDVLDDDGVDCVCDMAVTVTCLYL